MAQGSRAGRPLEQFYSTPRFISSLSISKYDFIQRRFPSSSAMPPLLTGRELPGVFDDAIARLEHALDLAALGALGQPAIRKGHVRRSEICHVLV